MKTMNPTSIQVPTPVPESVTGIVISYSNIPIISSDPSLSTPSNSHNTLDSIGSSHSSLPLPLFTKKSKQTTSLPALRLTLEAFLYGDHSSSLPEFGEWVRWSRDRGYTDSRVIISNNHLHLLASSKEEDLDVYELPYTRGGVRRPILRRSFTSVQIGILNQMLQCRNVSGGNWYCGYCPCCLRFHTDRKVFVNKGAVINRLESENVELKELIEKGEKVVNRLRRQVAGMERCGYKGLAKVFGKRLKRLEGWVDDPEKHLRYRELEIERLQSDRKVLQEHSKLIQEPHWLISVSCPTPLHVLYDAQDAWLTGRVQESGRRSSEGLQRILEGLEGKEGGFAELMRFVFRKLVVEAVQAQHPEIELTMEHQMHPFNKWDNSPDVHFLVCTKTLDGAGKVVDVSFDKQTIRRNLEVRMLTFAEFAVWAGKHWNDGCRATEFKAWKRKVLSAAETIRVSGIPEGSVDVRQVPVQE